MATPDRSVNSEKGAGASRLGGRDDFRILSLQRLRSCSRTSKMISIKNALIIFATPELLQRRKRKRWRRTTTDEQQRASWL